MEKYILILGPILKQELQRKFLKVETTETTSNSREGIPIELVREFCADNLGL